MAPELIHGPDYGTKVDVFSAGLILYILLSGVSPFPSESPDEIIRKNIKGEIYYPEKNWKDVSSEAVDLVLSMTQQDPALRPTANDCMDHQWFKMHHPEVVQRDRPVAPD